MIFQIKENTITAYGTIWEGNGMEFVSIFSQLESKYENIKVKLHTYGGSVFDGNLMFNALCNSKKSVVLEIVGIAASMGAVLALSLDEVYMVENGYLMIHTCSGQTYGSALDHENNAKLLRSIENNFIKKLMKKTGKSESYVKKWLQGDNWLDAETAKKEGLIKDIIEAESDTITANLNPQELGAEGMYYQFTALLNPENSQQINLDHNMKKPIIEALALEGVNEQSSDTAVIEAVKKHFEAKNAITQGKLDAEIVKRVAAENALADQVKTAITAEIEAGIKSGKITADQKATYEAIGTASGIEALKTVLAAIPARQTITGQMANVGSNNAAAVGREAWNWDQWQKEDSKGLEAMLKDSPEQWQALYNAKYKK